MTYKQQYMKERRRIQQNVARMKKRGYEFVETPLPPIPKRITQGSINRLKKITPKKLYEKATAKDLLGNTITGKKKRQLERKQAAVKAKRTRKEKKEIEKLKEKGYTNEDIKNEYNSGEIILQRIEEMIQEAYNRGYDKSAKLLQDILDGEIKKAYQVALSEGKENPEQVARQKVGYGIGLYEGDAFASSEIILHYRMSSAQWSRAFMRLTEIIRGYLPTAEETVAFTEIIDSDEWIDDLE